MAHAPTITLPVKADPRGLADFARVVAKHMTALADELDGGDRISRDEFAEIVDQALTDAGAIYGHEMPAAAILAAAAKLAP